MENYEIELLRYLAKSWNNLDVSFIEEILTDDFIYESQWVLNPLVGKQQFLSYLNAKFSAIKKVRNTQVMTVSAEMAFHKDISERPCLILSQITNSGIRQVSVLVESVGNKLKRIDVCFIPDPSKALLTGEIPK
ncbi:MAG: hypothetical protein IT215_06580 [Chitinophagaceae bacterium]|nr:hypothetical protein [Chitinophagaceae bacterium]